MYKLHTHLGVTRWFGTMGDVLFHLNREFQSQDNPYIANTGDLSLEHAGVTYPIGRNKSTRGIFPLFTNAVGSAVEWLDKWISEVLIYAYTKNGTNTVLSPQQMTWRQWGAISELSSIAYSVYPMFTSQQRAINGADESCDYQSIDHYFSKTFFERFGYGHNGTLYDGKQTNSRHDVHVAYALAHGEDVPAEVISDYHNQKAFSSDLNWFRAVIDKPFLRGRFKSVDHLQAVMSLLTREKNDVDQLTEANTNILVDGLSSLRPDANYVEIDNVLFNLGFLKARPQSALPDAGSLGIPCNAFAEKLRGALGSSRAKNECARVETDFKSGRLTNREYSYMLGYANSLPGREDCSWANRVATAIQEKSLDAMLAILCGTNNETSQKAVEQEFGIKLRNVTAAQRRTAVFGLAGFTDPVAIQVEENRMDQAVKDRKQAREFKDALEHAGRYKIKMDGGDVMTCAAFVDTLIERGFDRIESRKTGATRRYYLINPVTRNSYAISKANGTLDYAKLMVEKLTA